MVAHPAADGVGEGRADEEPPWRRCEQPGVVPWPGRDTGAGRSRRRPAPAVGRLRRGGGPPGSQGNGPPLPALGRRARRGGRARSVRGRRARNRRWGWESDRSPKEGRGRSGGDPPPAPAVGAAPVHHRADQAVQKDDGRSAGAQHPNGELAGPGHLARRRRPRGPTTAHGAVRVEERSYGSALPRPVDPTRTTPETGAAIPGAPGGYLRCGRRSWFRGRRRRTCRIRSPPPASKEPAHPWPRPLVTRPRSTECPASSPPPPAPGGSAGSVVPASSKDQLAEDLCRPGPDRRPKPEVASIGSRWAVMRSLRATGYYGDVCRRDARPTHQTPADLVPVRLAGLLTVVLFRS